MAWTTPKSWTTEPLTSYDLNTHLRDNLIALKSPPTATVDLFDTVPRTTSSTTFTPIDATHLSHTLTTTGGDLLVGFSGLFYSATTSYINLDLELDSVLVSGDDGLVAMDLVAAQYDVPTVSFTHLITNVAPGSHTLRMMWKTTTGTVSLICGPTNASGIRVHNYFWVREIS